MDSHKRFTYRVRGIPQDFDLSGTRTLLEGALETHCTVDSLALNLGRRKGKVATIRLVEDSSKLQGPRTEWRLHAVGADGSSTTLTIDTHFDGMTPLHDPVCLDEEIVDCVAISGLGSHAFGSWKDRDSHFMWLRDALPVHLPKARILIYGYDTKLADSSSFQNLADVASRFRVALRINLGTLPPNRPLIFIAHSLGGLVMKQALVQMSSGDIADTRNFTATFSILFFGVPNQGMDINSLLAMVRDQRNLPFLTMLSKDASPLQELIDRFRELFHFRDSYIYSFYETYASPTVKKDDTDKWSMSGDFAVLVDRYSARSGRSWEEDKSHLYPISSNHSGMVKFSEYSEDCACVLNILELCAKMAPTIIAARQKNSMLDPSRRGEHLRPPLNSGLSFPSTTDVHQVTLTGSTPSPKHDGLSNDGSLDTSDQISNMSMLDTTFTPHLDHSTLQDAGRVLERSIGDHYNHGKHIYGQVGVLLITWEEDDLRCIEEVHKLRALFEERFGFSVTIFQIPSESSELRLMTEVAGFLRGFNSPDCLAVTYFAGHGYEGTTTRKYKLAAKVMPDADGDPRIFFHDLLICLRTAVCDQLVILDCCFSARAFGLEDWGKGKFELLVSGEQETVAPSLPGSFTATLITALYKLIQEHPGGFSTSHLYREVYHTVRKQKPLHFDQSSQNLEKIWLTSMKTTIPGPADRQGKYYVHLKAMLDHEPLESEMHQLGLRLRYLPFVSQLRMTKLYSARAQLESLVSNVIIAQRFRRCLSRRIAQRKLLKS